MDAWRLRYSMVDLSDGVFIAVVLVAAVVGATAGTTLVWAWDRWHR